MRSVLLIVSLLALSAAVPPKITFPKANANWPKPTADSPRYLVARPPQTKHAAVFVWRAGRWQFVSYALVAEAEREAEEKAPSWRPL